ncbi:DeoR family transcriptional regulator [Opitutaceae bacterium TAV5]|nr:DeoR family transcriptional regulator [Opitutaceae bacterium TAV5]
MNISTGNKPSQVRRREILELLRKREHCTIAELKKQFGVSIPTIHRDIDELAEARLVSKIHGGVEYLAPLSPESSATYGFEDRMNRQSEAKQEIARKAVVLIEEDDVVFLDSSTTALHLAREVARSKSGRLTLITNSCSIIGEFPSFPPSMTLISIGGTYHGQLHSFLGGIAVKTVESLRINKVFFSAVGVSANGVFTFHEDHAAFLARQISRCAPVLLADSSKFGREALFRVCELPQLNAMVSDQKPPKDILQALRNTTVKIL